MPRTLSPPAVPDAELVRRFVAARDEAAFELLVWRYRGLVAGVCRRALGHAHDAEDAMQAAFLVFARKADGVRGEALAPWLARVAHRCALRVRRGRKPFAALPEVPAAPPPDSLDVYLDAELDKLPEKYRRPLVLCYLHGLSYAQASERLNCPTGTLCGWLTRGKELLRKRLARRGVAVPAGAFTAHLGGLGATSAAHHQVRELTTAAVAFAAGEHPSGPPATVAHGVLTMMGLKRISLFAACGLAVLLAGSLAVLVAGEPKTPDEPKAVAAKPDKPIEFDRSIGKEPKYAGKPAYCLLAFDAAGKERVWLVHDGDALYVDKNGNGDLTDDGEKFTTAKSKDGDHWTHNFDIGDVTTGGTTHKKLTVGIARLDRIAADNFLGTLAPIEPTLKKDKTTPVYALQVESARPGVKGSGADGRIPYRVGGFDANGVLQFAPTSADAPVIHFGGRFELWNQFGERVLRTGQDEGFRMTLGAPGFGPGTLACVPYDNNIPDDAHPVAEITFPAKPGEKPRTQVVPVNLRTCGYSLDARFKCGEETGSATVRFSFDAWKAGNVAPTTHSVAIQPPLKLTGPKAEPVSERLIATLPHPGKGAMPKVQYSPDGKRLLAIGDMYSGVVQLWDVDGRKELFQIAGPKPTRRADGDRDMAFLAEEYALLDPTWKTLHLPTRGERGVRVEKDGKKVTVVENVGRVRRWDLTTRKELEPYNPPKGWGNLMADLSPGGRFLYLIEHKNAVQGEDTAQLAIWDTTTGERVAILEGNYGSLPMFLPGDKAIAIARLDKQSNLTVRIHSLPDGKEVVSKTVPGPIEWAARLVGVSADGKLLAVNLGGAKGKQTTTLFLDAKTLAETARWTGTAKPIFFGHTAGTFTPDGKRFLVIDGDNTLTEFDIAAKKTVRTVKLEGTPMRLTVSPDGRWFGTHWMPEDPNKFAHEVTPDPQSMPQPRVVLVDLTDPDSKAVTLIAPRGTAWGMAFRPDGKQLALGGSGGVHLFDLTTAGK